MTSASGKGLTWESVSVWHANYVIKIGFWNLLYIAWIVFWKLVAFLVPYLWTAILSALGSDGSARNCSSQLESVLGFLAVAGLIIV